MSVLMQIDSLSRTMFARAAALLLLAASGCADADTPRSALDSAEAHGARPTQLPQQPHAGMPAPQVPEPPPSGWKEFDAYYEKLRAVHAQATSGSPISSGSITELRAATDALASSADSSRNATAELRAQLKAHANALEEATKSRKKEEQLGNIQRMLATTMQMASAFGPAGAIYVPKLQQLVMQLDQTMQGHPGVEFGTPPVVPKVATEQGVDTIRK